MTNTLTQKYYPYRQWFLALLISLTVISCVTINIYFPAAAAEKAAEKIVDEVLHGGSIIESPSEESSDDSQSLKIYQQKSSSEIMVAMVNFLIPAAQASQANLSINSSKIRSIRNKMEKRQSKLLPYYKAGNVGFTSNGLIASVNNNGLSIKQKSSVKKLIKAENNDRKALYAEIANANGHPEWQADIQKTFSKTWINKISRGWMYQTPAGKWVKK